MTTLWIVTNSEGADLACDLRKQAMEHAAEMAADFPQLAPWNVTKYVPASELAAAKALLSRVLEHDELTGWAMASELYDDIYKFNNCDAVIKGSEG